jgi:hypothetical protein
MFPRTAIILACGALVAAGASAQERTPYDRLKSCNAQAAARKDLKPDQREKARQDCMEAGAARGNTASEKPAAQPARKNVASAQPGKTVTCNVEAAKKRLTGDARQKFMTECLKG